MIARIEITPEKITGVNTTPEEVITLTAQNGYKQHFLGYSLKDALVIFSKQFIPHSS